MLTPPDLSQPYLGPKYQLHIDKCAHNWVTFSWNMVRTFVLSVRTNLTILALLVRRHAALHLPGSRPFETAPSPPSSSWMIRLTLRHKIAAYSSKSPTRAVGALEMSNSAPGAGLTPLSRRASQKACFATSSRHWSLFLICTAPLPQSRQN